LRLSDLGSLSGFDSDKDLAFLSLERLVVVPCNLEGQIVERSDDETVCVEGHHLCFADPLGLFNQPISLYGGPETPHGLPSYT